MKIRVADYIAQRLAQWNVKHLFLVTGGGAMHLNDAIGRCDGLEYICCHHEQACAMAAEAYSRVTGAPGVVNVTTGPGGINALNGVFGAYTDSIPMLVVSGQVKRETCMASYNIPGLRQLGDQEANIIDMVRGITKYAALIDDPASIRYHLEKAWYLAAEGRPGPVWLDVPVDVQGSLVEPDELVGFTPEVQPNSLVLHGDTLKASVADVLQRLATAKRPVILAGHGVRMAGAQQELLDFAARLNIPVTAAWNAADLVPNDHPCYAGRPGTVGERAGNFAVQNADVCLVLGCRLNIRQVSYAWHHFAREAFKIQVDVDPLELDKPTVKPDLGICADAGLFLREALAQSENESQDHTDYLDWCRERVQRFSVVSDEQRGRENLVSGYHFIEQLGEELDGDDVIVTANGAASVMLMQAIRVRQGQRILANSGSASMGYDVPGAIGACIGHGRKRVICLAGDGSIMMNLQELQTIAHHRLPVKIFVWNNGLYLSIRTTQQSFFGGNLVGEGETSGVSNPDFVKLGEVFGFSTSRIENNKNLSADIRAVLEEEGPSLCEIMMPHDELMLPKTSSLRLPDGRMVSKPLEDMFPFLSREEFAENMLIAPLED
ncbi:MAG TPA: thiamine pyrophosphate-binding protein [Abditibacteriaceae bacterium]|jgi:acetolactate synthase-1/2/3 large subunit